MRAGLATIIGIETVFHAISIMVSAIAVNEGWAYEANTLYYSIGGWVEFGVATWLLMVLVTLAYYAAGARLLVYAVVATKAANAVWDLTVFLRLNALDPTLFQYSVFAMILALSLYYAGREIKSIMKSGKKGIRG